MIAWQTIDNAPVDGTFVLLRGGHIDRDSTDEDTKHPPCVVAYCCSTYSNRGCWIITDYDGGAAYVCYENPTEWASLEEVRA